MYHPRVVDTELANLLDSVGAVLIEGARACGKTATASQQAGTQFRLDVDESTRQAADIAPELLMQGTPPILLDEWQLEPRLWNHVRRAVDDGSPSKGLFILTGSAVPFDDVRRHSGAGRVSTLRMRPMSLFESGQSSGEISLRRLFDGDQSPTGDSGLTVPSLVERIVIGGWPGLQENTPAGALLTLRGYLEQTSNVDLERVDGRSRDPQRIWRLFRALARNIATEVRISSLTADVGGPEGPADRTTLSSDVELLSRLMVIEDQPAWGPHLRSRVPARLSPKRHFVDPSLATAALNAGPQRLLEDLQWTGFLFESLVVRDLRVYAEPLTGSVSHFRNAKGLEADAIVQLADGRWGGFEVKLGLSQVDAGAASLLRLAEQVDTSRSGEPCVLAVITTTGMSYRRPDGVWVISIGSLGP